MSADEEQPNGEKLNSAGEQAGGETLLPAKRAIRSRRSSNNRATPDPTVPNPTMATLATSISTLSPLLGGCPTERKPVS